MKPSNEPSKRGELQTTPSIPASTSPSEACERYRVAGLDVFENWAHRVNAPREAKDKADEWLEIVERAGPDMVPHVTRTVMGREEHTSIFPEVDLVISYRELPDCVVGIIDVSSLTEHEGRLRL